MASATGTAPVAADGCFDLIVRATSHGPSAFVYTPLARAHRVTIHAGDHYIGVRLRPGFGAALVRHPDVILLAERSAAASCEDLEALVVSAVDAHPAQPNIVTDFLEEARATAGSLRLTGCGSRAHERELQRACRSWLGVSPKAFLRIERVWAARASIRRGSPLAMVAADLGYADQADLTREIRELLGLKPRDLRAVGILQDEAARGR